MKKNSGIFFLVKLLFGIVLAVTLAVCGYVVLISIRPDLELTHDNAAVARGLELIGGMRDIFFIVVLPMTVIMALTFFALMILTPGGNEVALNKSKKEVDPEMLFLLIDELKAKKRVTPKMIMPAAVKLEKLKNSHKYRADESFQVRARTALNWCYGRLGEIEYRVEATHDETMHNA